ncbi:hypothetical protein HQ531_00305 [bacterium]|nr:hypothetical protein [bacterium]
MNYTWRLYFALMSTLLIVNCASNKSSYVLPSVTETNKPEWVGTQKAARDTIFIVIHLEKNETGGLDNAIQRAQSELHSILKNEIEIILRDYWDQKQIQHSEAAKFLLLSDLPLALEQMMNYVTVSDGWEQSEGVSILCALDYEEVADILMSDMGITDRSFLSYFKRRMDELAQRYS